MDFTVINGKDMVAIHLEGRFDFAARRAFAVARDKALADAARRIQVNFSNVDYIDSAALGMLLILRERAQSVGKSVHLADCSPPVRQLVEIVRLDGLFAFAP